MHIKLMGASILSSMMLTTVLAGGSRAALTVYLDFTTDIGNGSGGAMNAVADWVDNLDVIASGASIPLFTPAERADIEAGIKSQMESIYGAYDVTFATTVPGGSHERINFGAYTAGGDFGEAPLDFMNLGASDGMEPTAAKVYSHNFGFAIESGDSRATTVAKLTTALAGTGAHELGHSLGLQHHHAYGDAAITPANYGDTGGVQNTHIMATGTTGLDADGRFVERTLSQWSQLTLEAAGGAFAGAHGGTGTPLASTVLVQSDSISGPDVGDTPLLAKELTLTFMPVSKLFAANTFSTLFSPLPPGMGDADIDVYKFVVGGASRLLADVWSDQRYGDDFNAFLTLYDTDGTTVLATNNDTVFLGNTYGAGDTETLNASLLNILLPTAGTYFLAVGSVGNLAGIPGGHYSLLFGVSAIPEPRAWLMLSLAAIGVGAVVGGRRLKSGDSGCSPM